MYGTVRSIDQWESPVAVTRRPLPMDGEVGGVNAGDLSSRWRTTGSAQLDHARYPRVPPSSVGPVYSRPGAVRTSQLLFVDDELTMS